MPPKAKRSRGNSPNRGGTSTSTSGGARPKDRKNNRRRSLMDTDEQKALREALMKNTSRLNDGFEKERIQYQATIEKLQREVRLNEKNKPQLNDAAVQTSETDGSVMGNNNKAVLKPEDIHLDEVAAADELNDNQRTMRLLMEQLAEVRRVCEEQAKQLAQVSARSNALEEELKVLRKSKDDALKAETAKEAEEKVTTPPKAKVIIADDTDCCGFLGFAYRFH